MQGLASAQGEGKLSLLNNTLVQYFLLFTCLNVQRKAVVCVALGIMFGRRTVCSFSWEQFVVFHEPSFRFCKHDVQVHVKNVS